MIRDSEFFLDDPRDILHRFTPTPFQSMVRLNNSLIHVASNDLLLLPPLVPEESPPEKSEAEPPFFWRLVRDPQAPGPLHPPVQFSVPGGVSAVFFGSACLIAVDTERSQLVSFVGTQVDGKDYRELVLPVLYTLSVAGVWKYRAAH